MNHKEELFRNGPVHARLLLSARAKKVITEDGEDRKKFLAHGIQTLLANSNGPLLLSKKRYLIVTKWGYPFGGGEAFMFQTISWALSLGMEPYWISFCLADNKSYEIFSAELVDGVPMIHVPGGYSDASLEAWMRLIRPDIVHHQGHIRMEVANVCKKMMVPFVTGYHFWIGLLDLDESTFNTKIIENAAVHRVSQDYLKMLELPNATHYVVSPYMQHAVKKVVGTWIEDLILPISDLKTCTDAWSGPKEIVGYVTQINIHKLKGGELFLKCLEELSDVKFMAVRTELFSDELDAKIKSAIDNHSSPSIYMERTEDVKAVYAKTSVLLVPSLVDETFCRVALEGMFNGIPIITTGYGNIIHIVGDAGIVLSETDPDMWVKAVRLLTTNPDFYSACAARVRVRAEIFKERYVIEQFEGVMARCLNHCDGANVALFAPWGDQGLGIQCRNYNSILGELGFRTHVFSFGSYFAKTKGDRHQKNPKEWEHPRIYYSENVRENVLDEEVVEFINRYRISRVILPETCWGRVFEIARLLRMMNVRCYAVPNLEIVRRDEVHLHRYFYKILGNNVACVKAFESRGFKNCELIRYSIKPPLDVDRSHIEAQVAEIEGGSPLRLLCLGGMNAFTRKQVIEVCQATVEACKAGAQITLTCTVQGKTDPAIDAFRSHPSITIIDEHLSYQNIVELYMKSHINVQVSKHEGLGLGFYEAISMSVPTITLDTPPHNEIIQKGLSGWMLPCTYKPMLDNTCGVVESAYFDVTCMAHLLMRLDTDRTETAQIYRTTLKTFHQHHGLQVFKQKFYNALQ